MENKLTAELLGKLKSAKNVDEMIALAKEKGVEIAKDAAEKLMGRLKELRELTDEEIEKAVGGSGVLGIRLCSQCGTDIGYNKKCPFCGV